MLKLPNVTLVAIDTIEPQLTALALRDTLAQVEPASVVILSNTSIPYKLNHSYRLYLQPQKLNLEEVCRMRWYGVARHITTSHILFIEWDGWAINADSWTDDFLQYDYIGAPWPWHNAHCVGNGGFSLRSTKLLNSLFTKRGQYFHSICQRMQLICRQYRGNWRPFHAIRFAPEHLAWRFSQEHVDHPTHVLDPRPFGFHDARNWRRFLTPQAFRERIDAAGPYALKRLHDIGVLR